MKNFIVRTGNSFRFTSNIAKDDSEIFTAFLDEYEHGYVIIDSENLVYILDVITVAGFLSDGTYEVITGE